MDITDPYPAYCFDTACEYIEDQLQHKKLPRFPDNGSDKGRTTNAALIAEMQRLNKRTGGGR